jgi:hypothetical protein
MDALSNPPVAFEPRSLDAAVREVMRLAAADGKLDIMILGTGLKRDLGKPDEVRDYLVQTTQRAYAAAGRITEGAIGKLVYRGVGVVFERIVSSEIRELAYAESTIAPVHVAQFWLHLH